MYIRGPQAHRTRTSGQPPAASPAEPVLHIAESLADLVLPAGRILPIHTWPLPGQLAVVLLPPGCSCWALAVGRSERGVLRGDVKAPCGVAALLMPKVVVMHLADPYSASLCVFSGRFAKEDHV